MIKNVYGDFLDILFPPARICPFCGGRIDSRDIICLRCRKKVSEFQEMLQCAYCGRFFELKGNQKVICSECRGKEWPFRSARAVGPHKGFLKQAVQQLKYSGRQILAVALGSLMADVAVKEKLYCKADLVLPVPLSQQRVEQRGFNQAELLARQVARVLGLVVDKTVLQKRFDTPPQAGLSKMQREKNLQGAFFVKNSRLVAGRRVLLVDDVLTTGSTLAAASGELLNAGVSCVTVLTATTGLCKKNPLYYSR